MDDQQQAQNEYIAAAEAGMNSNTITPYVAIDALGQLMLNEFKRAEIDRMPTEQRWLRDLRQYRGVYDPEVEALIGKNRSKAFNRATRVKVKTVDARVADLLFPSGSERNWTADPSPVPSLDKDSISLIAQALAQQLQRAPTKLELDAAVVKAVAVAADAMTKVMDDQLSESRYKQTARMVLHSGHLYGTGILKAPLVERKTRSKFTLVKGKWKMQTESYVTPFVDYVPVWRFYPDMASTELENCRYVFERHLFTHSVLSGLAARKSFDGDKIKAHILANPNGLQNIRQFDAEIRLIGHRISITPKDDGIYEVLERWGWIDGQTLSNAGVFVPPNRLHETFFSNVWMFPNGEVIKVVLQPINGVTWPYHMYYFDKDETSIFGDGLASIMRDDQEMINAGTRMILDHAAITAGPQIEVNMKLLADGEKADDMHPFKIWQRNGDDPNSPLIRVVKLENGLEELMPIVQMFQTNADDVTAIPRYMQGQNAAEGAAGTASGMSMLMSSASIVMKDLITNYDEGITRPFIEALYKWNMQFNPDNSIKGDYDITARGTASLMAKEVRAQQLDQFAQMASNPLDAPYIKREELLRQRAEAHDLTDVVKTEEEVTAEQNSQASQQAAAAQQQLQQQMQALQMQMAQSKLDQLQAEIAKTLADVDRIKALTVKANVDTAYAGMEAGGVATERPEVAPAGDAILKSAGWVDHTPAIAQQPGAPVPSNSAQAGSTQTDQSTQDGPVPAGMATANLPVPPQAAAAPPDQSQPSMDGGASQGQGGDPLTPPSANVGANVGERVGEHVGMGQSQSEPGPQ
jgi:hypothetical protein